MGKGTYGSKVGRPPNKGKGKGKARMKPMPPNVARVMKKTAKKKK